MKIYYVDPKKSKINWSSRIGDLQINGEVTAHDGKLIAELDQVVEGQLSVDLNSLKIVNSSLSKDDEEKLQKHLKSAEFFDGDTTLAQYKIEQIIPNHDDYTIKGMLNFKGLGFGMNVEAELEHDDRELHAKGKIRAGKSNPVFLEELERIFSDQIQGDKSIKTFEIDCEINANTAS